MGTHSLTSKYRSLPEALRASLVGTDYDMPSFGKADTDALRGYRVALVTTHGPELPEFDVPLSYLRQRGAGLDVITQDWLFDYQPEARGMVVLAQWLAVNVCVQADMRVSDASIEDYDAVITIGGAWNPILLRTDEAILNFIRGARNRGLLIASTCHGPQVLISMDALPPGTLATGVGDIKRDMANAGFDVLDDPIVYDEGQRLITSRDPNFLEGFCSEIGKRLVEVPPRNL
jgi:protease I